MEQTECSETSAYKIQTPGNNTEENINYRNINFTQVTVFSDVTTSSLVERQVCQLLRRTCYDLHRDS